MFDFRVLGAVLIVVCTTSLTAQYPAPQPQQVQLPPLLHVKLDGPPGMKVTIYRGAKTAQTYTVPFSVGLRPGYAYRFEISNVPEQPHAKFYPSLEVHGSLLMPTKQRAADFPAALVFSADDFSAVAAGALVTKVVALERPDTAAPIATRADRPLEFSAGADRDPVAMAQEYGRPLAILRMGQRQFSPDELAAQGIPGTVLLPKETVLPSPRDLPWLRWTCIPLFDPRLGPAHPSSELCFHDGGDGGLRAGYNRDGRLTGLDPSDTIAEYADSKGQRRISASNRVSLCVPRFIVTRGETATSTKLATFAPGHTGATHGQSALGSRTQTVEQHQNEHLSALASKQRTSGAFVHMGTAVVGRIDGLSVVSTLHETGNVTGSPVSKPAPAEPVDLPLLLDKWPDKSLAAIGDVVTFYLKYTNRGGRPITHIAVTDSLPARLEYVAGSARADRDGVFTTQPNDAGTLILRWEINGALPPGQSGIVSFQARIR